MSIDYEGISVETAHLGNLASRLVEDVVKVVLADQLAQAFLQLARFTLDRKE